MSAATKQDVLSRFLDRQLSSLLLLLEEACLPPTDEHESTVWPGGHELGELDSTVLTLAIMERKRPPASRWKAYKCVNKRCQRHHLVSRVEKLVRRARARLQEENEMDLKIAWPSQLNPDRFRREAFLEWIAHLENSDFLDVIDIVYDPDPQLHKGESYSLPHGIINTITATRKVMARHRERKQGAKRAANYRDRLKKREKRLKKQKR